MRRFLYAMLIAGSFSLVACREEKPPVAAEAQSFEFKCAEKTVTFILGQGDQAEMRVEGAAYPLIQTISASGARYEAVDDPSTIFWNKGRKAFVTIKGQEWPECDQVE